MAEYYKGMIFYGVSEGRIYKCKLVKYSSEYRAFKLESIYSGQMFVCKEAALGDTLFIFRQDAEHKIAEKKRREQQQNRTKKKKRNVGYHNDNYHESSPVYKYKLEKKPAGLDAKFKHNQKDEDKAIEHPYIGKTFYIAIKDLIVECYVKEYDVTKNKLYFAKVGDSAIVYEAKEFEHNVNFFDHYDDADRKAKRKKQSNIPINPLDAIGSETGNMKTVFDGRLEHEERYRPESYIPETIPRRKENPRKKVSYEDTYFAQRPTQNYRDDTD